MKKLLSIFQLLSLSTLLNAQSVIPVRFNNSTNVLVEPTASLFRSANGIQPLDADLTAISNISLVQNQFYARIAAGSGPVDTGITIGPDFSLAGNTLSIVSSSAYALLAGNNIFTGANTFSNVVGVGLFSTSPLFWGSGDVSLYRLGAANLRLGGVPSATPLAQTLTIGEASRPSIDSNAAGGNGIITSGTGTGTGTPSQLIFRTAGTTTAGTSTQTLSTRMTMDILGATFNNGFLNVSGTYHMGSGAYSTTSNGAYGFVNSASVPATIDTAIKEEEEQVLFS